MRIPSVRRSPCFVYRGDSDRRRFSALAAYREFADRAIANRTAGGCGCVRTLERNTFGDDVKSCRYHDHRRYQIVERLARWLKWRDERFGLTRNEVPLCWYEDLEGEKGVVHKMRYLKEMRGEIERMIVELDARMAGGVS